MKSGFVGLIGRPNTGKSTLMNTILNKKVAITSNKPQTTRNNIWGIYNEEDTQIVFVDTPGIHKANHKLGHFLNNEAYYSLNDVDIILFLVDIKEGIGTGDKFILEKIKEAKKTTILIINKIDNESNVKIMETITAYKDLYDFKAIIPVSALNNRNVDEIIKVLKENLTDNVKYFADNQISNKEDSFIISELVREKIFHLTFDEIPHSLTCLTEKLEEKQQKYIINVTIIVDREALKKIIVGKNGTMIKKIGTLARLDMEKFLDKKVYLELFVKVVKNWRDKEKYLKEFGFSE